MAYRKSKRSKTLVGKDGRMNKNNYVNIEAFKNQIMADPDYDSRTKKTLINQLDAKIYNSRKNKKKLTVNGFLGFIENDKIRRLLTNAGYTAEELAQEIGVNEDDILEATNWDKNIFKFGDDAWELTFNYIGEILRKR